MSDILDSLFQNLEDTLESGLKDIKSAHKSADSIANGLGELMSSFDVQEVRRIRGTWTETR
jgi:hypothetical protein